MYLYFYSGSDSFLKRYKSHNYDYVWSFTCTWSVQYHQLYCHDTLVDALLVMIDDPPYHVTTHALHYWDTAMSPSDQSLLQDRRGRGEKCINGCDTDMLRKRYDPVLHIQNVLCYSCYHLSLRGMILHTMLWVLVM